MSNLGRYCKAYYLKDLRAFTGWIEPAAPGIRERPASAADALAAATSRADDDVVFLHEDFAVTDGIARDEGVLFENADAAWQGFCREALSFEVPAWCSEDESTVEQPAAT